MNKKALEQKRETYNNFLKQDPNNFSIINQLITLDFQLGEFDTALSHIDTLANHQAQSDEILFLKSNILLAKGDSQLALDLLSEHRFSKAAYAAVEINKGHANFQLGNFEAVDNIITKLESYPEPSVYLLHARSLHHLGRIDSAIELLKKGLLQYAEDYDIIGLLSLLMLDNGIYEAEALDYAEEALSHNPNQLEGLLAAGMLQQHFAKDLVKAEKYFDQAINRHPNSGRGWLYKGMSVMMKKEIAEAQSYLQKACELMPEHIGSWHTLAWSNILLQNISDARDCFEKAMLLDRNFAETHGGLSIVEAMEGDFDKAEKTARLALRLNPQSFSAQYTLIILAESNNEPEKIQSILSNVFDTEQGKEALDFINIIQNKN